MCALFWVSEEIKVLCFQLIQSTRKFDFKKSFTWELPYAKICFCLTFCHLNFWSLSLLSNKSRCPPVSSNAKNIQVFVSISEHSLLSWIKKNNIGNSEDKTSVDKTKQKETFPDYNSTCVQDCLVLFCT